MHRRPYFFEVLTLASFAAIATWMASVLSPRAWLLSFSMMVSFLGMALIGVAIRYALSRGRGRDRAFIRIIRSRRWITDSARLILFSGFFSFTYGYIKLLIPIAHPRLFDQELWNLDTRLFFGISPNLLFVSLFSQSWALTAIDWTYEYFFLATILSSATYFLSAPDRVLRLAFMNSSTALWLSSAWLYVLVPSLGPAYRFPEVWLPLAGSLSRTQAAQHLLMVNYQTVLQGRPGPVSLLFGIAAFPSLHVAYATLVYLWMRRSWSRIAPLFAIFSILIFVGSMVTGWHYFIDSLAGVVLAWIWYAVFARGLPRQAPDRRRDDGRARGGLE